MSVMTGCCLCGDVAWEIGAPFVRMSHCHCSRCRKLHGTAFATYGATPTEHFRFTREGESLRAYACFPDRPPFRLDSFVFDACRSSGAIPPPLPRRNGIGRFSPVRRGTRRYESGGVNPTLRRFSAPNK